MGWKIAFTACDFAARRPTLSWLRHHSSVDCSKGVGQSGCVPGTTQYEDMMEKKKEAASTAAVDDTRCLAFGARGTTGYVECRRRAAEDTKFFNSKF